jgi:predicted SAM-dependent methyltransferase
MKCQNKLRNRKRFNLSIPEGKYLNLGCGERIRDGFINCDKVKSKGVQILLDLDSPLPFKDNSIDHIALDQVVAHVEHPFKLMQECERILKQGGQLDITPCLCPPEHRRHRYNLGGGYKKET